MDMEEKIGLVASLGKHLGYGEVISLDEKEGLVFSGKSGTERKVPFPPDILGWKEEKFDWDVYLDFILSWMAVVDMGLPEGISPEEIALFLLSEGGNGS